MTSSNVIQLSNEFNNQNVRLCEINGEKMLNIYDIIKILTEDENHITQTWTRLETVHPELNTGIVKFKFPGRGQGMTPCISVQDSRLLVITIISSLRISKTKKEQILQKYGIKDYEIMRTYIEADIHEKIMKTFNSCCILIEQYSILNYRIDLYCTDKKIAIECDEHNHIAYNKDTELERQQNITKILNCKWIRYNPYDKHFDIFDLLNKIMKELILS